MGCFVDEEEMARTFREKFTKDGLEYNKDDDDYIRTLAKMLNSAYEAGRQARLCNTEAKA